MVNKNRYTQDIACKYCGKLMTLDDIDYNFEGNQNNYWTCFDCKSSCFEKIRYGKSICRQWSKENT